MIMINGFVMIACRLLARQTPTFLASASKRTRLSHALLNLQKKHDDVFWGRSLRRSDGRATGTGLPPCNVCVRSVLRTD